MKTVLSFLLIFALLGCSEQTESEQNASSEGETTDIVKTVDEWSVPWDDAWSRDPNVAPDGNVYFVGQFGDYVGYFDPDTEEFNSYDLEEDFGPHTVRVRDDGVVWFTGFGSDQIGRIDAATDDVTIFQVEEERLAGPHSLAYTEDGNFWFTAYGGGGIGYYDTGTGEIQSVPVPTEESNPYGIAIHPDTRHPWIALFGTYKLATVDPETMEAEEVVLPREEIRPRRLDITSDGNVWYGDFAAGHIGRYNPEDGAISEWEMPDGPDSRPYAVLADDRDRLWISASGLDPNKLYAFDTQTETFVTSVEIESASGAIRNMDFDAENRAIWFGTDTGHIGRVIIN